ncbi:MAG: glycosyltransferase family 4 protein [Candidatus Brocadia sp.]|jgi:glycosyltransferase involved in cell wall biosynthesis
MNILHINKFHYVRGGAEAVYINTASLLESKGHRSVFFSMCHPQNLPCVTGDYFMPYAELSADRNSPDIVDQIRTAGRIIYSFTAKKRISRLLDDYPVDIAHLHNIYHHISPSILHVLKKRRVPVIMTLHDYKMVCASYHLQSHGKPCEACYGGRYFMAISGRCVKGSLVKSVLNTLEMYLHHSVLDIYNNVDVFISPSRFLKDKLFEMGFKKKIIHLPNYLDIEKFGEFNIDTGEGKAVRDKSVVYFGRLSHEKGLLTLLEAAKILKDQNRDFLEIKIIGDGPMRDELEQKVRTEGIDNVRFLGYMKGGSLYREVKKSLAVILPSEWYENNPMSVIEAFALSTPVIGARIGGIPELVKDNETGLTFQPGDAEDLSKKIKIFLDDNSLSGEMGEKARELARREFSAERYYQRLMEIYKKLLQGDDSNAG